MDPFSQPIQKTYTHPVTHPSSTLPFPSTFLTTNLQTSSHSHIHDFAIPSARIVENEVGVDCVMVFFGVHIFSPITGYYRGSWAVTYLGFHKGGAKFLLATSAHTKGAKPRFPIFSYVKKFFLPKRRTWPNGPLNTPLLRGSKYQLRPSLPIPSLFFLLPMAIPLSLPPQKSLDSNDQKNHL